MLAKKTRPELRKPSRVQITPRRLEPKLEGELPQYWADGDPFLTHFMNALSITFPPGERMFMDAVRAVRERVEDPQTREEIAGFMGQEALHSRAHQAFNDYLEKLGYPIAKLEQDLKDGIADNRNHHTKATLLALTCALEHITAMMGELLLSRPDLQEMMHDSARPLWLWHALEETEHKAVAFDVYQEVYGDYGMRARWLLFGTVGLLYTVTSYQRVLLQRDGLNKPSVWFKGLWRLWGKDGMLIGLLPMWLDYFRRDFHPWQHDNSELIQRYQAMLEALPEVSVSRMTARSA
jgi:predicted metal-dependent hydrolase